MDLIQFLIKNQLLKKKEAIDLRAQIAKEGKTAEEVILENRIVEEEELFKLKSEFLGIPLKKDLPEKIAPAVIALIPKESINFYKMIPLVLNKQERILEVAMIYPENVQAQEALQFLARQQKLTAKVFLITISDFQRKLAESHAPESEIKKALEELRKEMKVEEKKEEGLTFEKKEYGRLVEEAPIIKMVSVILRQAIEGGASDIHIEPTREYSKVRYRLDGILYPSLALPLNAHAALVARVKILSALKIDETRIPQDGRFSIRQENKRIDFRVSTFPTTLGEKVVLRVLDPGKGLKSLDQLGLEGHNLEVVDEVIKKPYGMILVTGPTGSGKSTTLYAVLKILNKEEVNIVTLEDPVEYFMEGISQSQVRPEINYTFARGLRQILRQDPDIIMVGEIRDEETASLAVHAALTGHLVLSTLHTNNAPGGVPRLVDMGVQHFLLPPTIALILSQRLVRTLCPHCKKKVRLEGGEKKYFLRVTRNLPDKIKQKIKEPIYLYKPVGCKKCRPKGYSGRGGIFEALRMTDRLASIINQNPTEAAIMKEGREQGMVTMLEDGALKALKGITSLEEIMRVAEEK